MRDDLDELSGVRAALAQRDEDIRTLNDALQARALELQSASSDVASRDAELARLASELRDAASQRDTQSAELQAMREQLSSRDARLSGVVAESAGQAGELAAAHEEAASLRAELDAVRSELEAERAAAEQIRAEREQARQRASQLLSEAESARAAAEAIRAEFAFDEPAGPADAQASDGSPASNGLPAPWAPPAANGQPAPWAPPAPGAPRMPFARPGPYAPRTPLAKPIPDAPATPVPAQPNGAAPELPACEPGIAAALIGLDGTFRRLDDAFCSLLGCREDELRAARWPSIIDRDNLKAHREIARALRAGELQSADIETIYMHAGGLLVPIEGTVSMLRDAGGQPTHYLFRADVRRTSGASRY